MQRKTVLKVKKTCFCREEFVQFS